MKTKRFYILGAMIAAAIATFAYQNQVNDKCSALGMENVEALSSGEINVEKCKGCSSDNSRTYCCTAYGLKLYRYP